MPCARDLLALPPPQVWLLEGRQRRMCGGVKRLVRLTSLTPLLQIVEGRLGTTNSRHHNNSVRALDENSEIVLLPGLVQSIVIWNLPMFPSHDNQKMYPYSPMHLRRFQRGV